MNDDQKGKPLFNKLEPRKAIVPKTAMFKSKSFKHEAKAWSKTGRNVVQYIIDILLS